VAEAAQADGAEAILFGGAVFAGIHREIGHRLQVPLFDGIGAATEAALAAPSVAVSAAPDEPTKSYTGVSSSLAGLIARKLRSPAPI
ncbi:MAG: hypothetical protein IT561_18810, partial [Alphaproteobacteria bacterium]|nr:hypothetical protein [Alphaproteobacteria bacterium]